jgi:hypothetical protein
MPLSLSKLEKLLSIKGLILTKFFIIDKTCVYIEVVSMSNADTFLLYIPSKYTIKTENVYKDNTYKLSYLEFEDIDKIDNVADNYAGEQDDDILENTYKEIDVELSNGENMSKHLEENYKKEIILKDITTTDSKEIKDIIRQLKRLRFCVQNVKYKVAVMYKNYLCTIKRDDTIECFNVKRFNSNNYKKLYITVDLETLYEKMDTLVFNMETVKKGIYNILNKNHFKNISIFQKLIEEKNQIIELSDNIYKKKLEYEKYMEEATQMLEKINTSEKKVLENIFQTNEKYNNEHIKGIHNDIEKSHILTKHNKDLKEIQKTKEDIVKTIFKLKTKREDIMLNVDKIMFDNNVMTECVLRNFNDLKKIS